MQSEGLIRLLFGMLFILFVIVRAVNVTRANVGSDYEYREKHHVVMQIFRKGIGLPWFAAILAYLFKPEWVAWASFPLPMWLRWAGLGLGYASLLLIWWTEFSLGKQFNTTLHIRADHELVTHGPYRWVRHPMYTALFLFVSALLIAPANWVIGVPGLLGLLVIMLVRVRHEEALMLEQFGDDYRAYMERTGRFLPKLS